MAKFIVYVQLPHEDAPRYMRDYDIPKYPEYWSKVESRAAKFRSKREAEQYAEWAVESYNNRHGVTV